MLAMVRRLELNFRTQYAELKERVRAAGPLLPGTPGTLMSKKISGRDYWYRVYYAVPKKRVEEYIGTGGDSEAVFKLMARIEAAKWAGEQVKSLRSLGFQVTTKQVARVLVEFYNQQVAGNALVLVGTQAYMALLNELGAKSVAAMTFDVDLGMSAGVELAGENSLLQTLQATRLPFVEVPAFKRKDPSASVQLPGGTLRIDLLTPGKSLGEVVALNRPGWNAQSVPFFGYLLKDPEPAAVLAGDHCIPMLAPQPSRFVWHKLYSTLHRQGVRDKAIKDRRQALTLAQVIAEDDDAALLLALKAADPAMRKELKARLPQVLDDDELALLRANGLST